MRSPQIKARTKSQPSVTAGQTSQTRPHVPRQAETSAAPAGIQEALHSPGQPLDPAVRVEMEARFGHDFSQVQVHTDAKAAQAARVVGAFAFTSGQDIFFAPGLYQPTSTQGRHLLAHELAHTIQQGSGQMIQARFRISQPGDSLECEADAAASRVVAGHSIPIGLISVATPQAQGVIARRAAPLTRVRPEPEAQELAQLLDPAQMIERLVGNILRNLQTDPDDRSAQVRRQLARLALPTREAVLARLQDRMTAARWERLAEVLAEPPPPGTEVSTPATPEPVKTAHPGVAEREPDQLAESGPAARTDSATGPEAESEAEPERDGGPDSMQAAREKVPPAPAEAGPAMEPEEEPSAEEAPKKPQIDAADVEQAAAEEGAPAPAAEATPPAKPGAAAGTAPSATAAGGSVPEAAADAGQEPSPAGEAAAGTAEVTSGEASVEAEAEPAEAAATESEAEIAAEPEPATAPGEAPIGAEAGATEGAEQPEAVTEPTTGLAEGDAEVGPSPEAPAEAAAEPAETETPAEAPAETGAEPAEAAPPPEASAETMATGEEAAPAAAAPLEPAAETTTAPAAASAAAPAPTTTTGPALGAAAPAPAMAELAAPEPTADAAAPVGGPEGTMEGVEAAGEAGTVAPGPGAEAAPGGEGGCSPSAADTAKPPEGGDGGEAAGGVCGGGGAAIQEQPAPAPPDVAQSDPAQAIAAVGNLPPAQLQTALGGVSAAASHTVGQQRQELAANPPQMERPSGVPAGRDAAAPVLPPAAPAVSASPQKVERTPAGEAIPVSPPAPLPAAPAPPTQAVPGPRLPGDAALTEADAAKAQAAVRNLPTTDPALNVTAGEPPRLELNGDADPKRAQEQRAKLDGSLTETQTQGQKDTAQPLGENNIYPTVPQETLSAQVKEGEGGGGPGVMGTLAACAAGGGKALAAAKAEGSPAAAGGAGAATDEAASIVAQEQKGDEIKAAVGQAQGDMVAQQQDHATKVSEEKTKSQQEMDKLVEANAAEQKDERTKARQDSQKLRGDWSQEQNTLVGNANKEATEETKNGDKKLNDQQTTANTQAATHIQTGNKEAADARKDGEQQAANERKKAENESSGFLSWVSNKVTSFFNAVKAAIQTVFEAARKLVRAAIEKAKKLATEVIEKARKAVVEIIHKVGDALIAIGDVVLAGFPKLRDSFRKKVQERVAQAEAVVNKLADKLKEGIQKALDALGAAINAVLGLLECAYLAAVDAVSSVVKGAIQFARSVVQGFAAFAALIKDIAAGPGQWLSNLGKAVVDGIRNCLWAAFKRAVKNWFNQKLEEVLGLGLMIWQVLFKGCIKMAEIGRMAWEGLKAAIPMVLIQILIEKLVAMIVPAAGAILTIIEGLRAAWGTVSRIITAFQLFFAFLKAVKTGNAAGPFAEAVAAAAIVVIDFVANWLLMRLRKPAGAIAGRLRALAQKIGKALGKVTGALKRGVKAGVGGLKRGVVAIGRGLKRGAAAVGRGVRTAGQAVGRRVAAVGRVLARTRVGRAAIRGFKTVQQTFRRGRERFRQWRERRKRNKQLRQERAFQVVSAALQEKLRRGISRPRLWALLQWYKLRYLFRALRAVKQGGASYNIIGTFNPTKKLAWVTARRVYLRQIAIVAKELHEQGKVQEVWKDRPTRRGELVEYILALREYKQEDGWFQIGAENLGFFPVIDFQLGLRVVSVKSIDPRLPSVQARGVLETLTEYVDQLAEQGITVGGQAAIKELHIVVPAGTITQRLRAQLNRYAGGNVRIRITQL